MSHTEIKASGGIKENKRKQNVSLGDASVSSSCSNSGSKGEEISSLVEWLVKKKQMITATVKDEMKRQSCKVFCTRSFLIMREDAAIDESW